ncbi:LysR family transcriptional regulator [Chitinasiproducens palmae]|uniref:Transcriptional regulator, LysR family n=1 Tax=Chitinasiproducens palmae TaxID=1770053 RepID=A0A1H2PIV0_9BURK|nr:LysR family transcriptional regulator [Chitinasiproducens palmae]SDV46118.1 transcriptional regulator, LysR family [Chitinasiproducens palmae]
MELTQLRSFLQVAESGSLSRAAAALGVSQPYLSRQIGLLEGELRTHLFYRHGRGVALTDAGQRFHGTATSVLRELDQTVRAFGEADDALSGRVSVGLPPSVGRSLTVDLVREFAAALPRASIAIVEGLSTGLQDALVTERLDIAFLYDRPLTALVTSEPVAIEPLCVVRRRNADCRDAPVSLAELSTLPLILPSAPHPIRTMLELAATREGRALRVAYEVDGVEAILQLAAAGLAATVANAATVRNGPYAGQLRADPLGPPAITSTLSLAMAARRPPTALVERTATLCRALAARLIAA